MNRNVRTGVLAAATAAAVAAAGCGSGVGGFGGDGGQDADSALRVDGERIASQELYSAALEEGSVTIYTSVNQSATDALQKAFTEDTGIEVEGIRVPTDELFQRILSEVGAGTFPADVIAMADQALWQQLADRNLLTPHTVPADKEIPDKHKGPDSLYYTLSLAPTTLAYNAGVVESENAVPKTWKDLLDSRWSGGRIGIKHAAAGAGGWSLALFMRDQFGKDYWEKFAAQKPVLESSVGALGERLGRGEIAIAAGRPSVVNDLNERGAPVEFIWPEEGGVPMFLFLIGQVRDSAHPSAAQVYLNWSMSKRGQSILATKARDYPVNPNATGPGAAGESLPPLSEIDPYIPQRDDWIELRESWTDEWNQIFGYRP